jgi:hypothetical protein
MLPNVATTAACFCFAVAMGCPLTDNARKMLGGGPEPGRESLSRDRVPLLQAYADLVMTVARSE